VLFKRSNKRQNPEKAPIKKKARRGYEEKGEEWDVSYLAKKGKTRQRSTPPERGKGSKKRKEAVFGGEKRDGAWPLHEEQEGLAPSLKSFQGGTGW